MEETRVTHLYLNQLKERIVKTWDFVTGGGWMRSGSATVALLVIVLGGVFLVYREHMKGHLHVIKYKIITGGAAPPAAEGPKPGGMDPMMLTRSRPVTQAGPEFGSVTLLPGLGMSVLQMTAYLPGDREVALLVAPSVEKLVSATPPAHDGPNDDYGALELPWAGALSGIAIPGANSISAKWLGHSFTIPETPERRGVAEGGLLRKTPADVVTPDVIPDGSSGNATFTATNFGEDWPGTVQTKVAVLMSSGRMDLTVTATNTGTEPVPVGIGWHPRFAIPGDRQGVLLKLPEADKLEMGERGLPSGKTVSSPPTLTRFMGKQGVPLKNASLNDLLVELKPALLEDGAVTELRFPDGGYGLRMTLVSSSIHALRVVAEPGKPYVSLGPQVNFDDPLGREWEKGPGSEMTVLAAGQTMEFRVKLEIFSLTGETTRSKL